MNRNLLVVILLVGVLIGGGIALSSRLRAASPKDKTQYRVAKAESGTVKKTVSASGTLQPWTVVDIKSKAGGRVDALLVDAGSTVNKGQIIARIDPSDTLLSVNTARADIDSARARQQQSQSTYQLQRKQSDIAIANALAALNSSRASRAAAKSRLDTAKGQATAQPELTQAAIQQAQENLNQAIKQREALNATNPQQLASARAAYNQAVANRKNAEENIKRQNTLLDKGFVAQQSVDTAQANYDVTKAQEESAKARLDTINDELAAGVATADARVRQLRAALANAQVGRVDIANRKNAQQEAAAALKQADAQVAQAEQAYKQAVANIANNEIKRYDVSSATASIARAQATMVNAQNTLDQTTVRAPTDGVVLKKYVEPGTIITSGLSLNSTGTSIVQIGDVTKMYVDVAVDETDIANVDTGQNVDVTIDSYPGVPFEGKVARVDPQAVVEQNVTTFHVRVEVDNSAPTFRLLKPGMNATCEFVVDKKDDVVSVPSDAVQTDDQGARYIEVATGGKPAPAPDPATPADPNTLIDVKLVRRPVEVGLEGNDTTEITSGVKDGDSVVIETIDPTPQQASSPFGGGGRGGFGGGGGRR